MRLRIKSVCLLTSALIICAGMACAQQDDQPLVTVEPQQLSVPENPDVTAGLLPDGTALSVSSAGLEQGLSLDLGWLPAEPNTAYRARYRVRPVTL